MSDAQAHILAELRRITRLLVLMATEGKIQKDQIAMLSRVGFKPREIAELVGTTANTVNVALSAMRRAAGTHERKTRRRGASDEE